MNVIQRIYQMIQEIQKYLLAEKLPDEALLHHNIPPPPPPSGVVVKSIEVFLTQIDVLYNYNRRGLCRWCYFT